MSRGFSSYQLDRIDDQVVQPILYAKLSFSSETLYVHDSIGTRTWGGNDWIGVGDFATVSSIEEGSEISPYSLNLTLSGLDAGLIAKTLNENYYMRPVDIYIDFIPSTGAATPVQIWTGFMDVMSVTAGASGGDSITLTCESEMAKFDRSANLRYTETMLRKRNSSDKFFEFLKDIDGVKILWGKKVGTAGGSSPNLNPTRPSYMK